MQYKVFWCKVNKYYTDKRLNSSYLRDKQGVFIASCVVTDQAKRKWIKFVKDIFKNEGLAGWAKIYISWCWAFKEGKAQDDFFDLYTELKEYEKSIEILWEDPEEKKIEWKMEVKKLDLSKISQKFKNVQIWTKKFVLIQWWCDSFCTFCLTVQKRGRHYFRNEEDIAYEINDFEESGWKEVVLTWVNLSAWGLESTNDTSVSRFAELLEYLLLNTKIPRLRISSMWPEFINNKCLKIFENKRIYPHFHFSVQSWSSSVLKDMKRHYDWEYIKKLLLDLRKIKRQDNVKISIWADIIVWFPWETEQDFKDSIDLIKDCNITKVHAFPFSAHKFWENVPAWFYKNQTCNIIKKDRMFEILSISEQVRDEFIDENIWEELEVLIELVKEDWSWKGWTQNYLEANETNFEVKFWEIYKNNVVTGLLGSNVL